MSLVTTPVHELPVCPCCSATRVTSITMTLTDGTPVDFLSCHVCERRSWSAAGHEMPISTVLTKAQKHRAA